MGGIEDNKINLYADDTLIIVKHPRKVLERIHSHLKTFEETTGLRVNWEKTEMIYCNGEREERENIKEKYKIQVKSNLKYLGVTISSKTGELKNLNYVKQKKDIEGKIAQYNKLNLSWFGRVALSKMMLLPKLNFLFDVLPIKHSDKELEEYQKIINNFCNGKRKARILWYLPQKEGGLGIPSIHNYYT